MAKSLLALVLITTQFLAGNCGSLHLCICNDGSYCCIDAGPAFCTCCQMHGEASHDAGCDDHCCAAVSERCCEHCDHDSTSPDAPDSVAGDPCGCTHFPLVISASQPTTTPRSTIHDAIERNALHIGWQQTRAGNEADVAPLLHRQRLGPPVVPDFALTVISTVVIRC